MKKKFIKTPLKGVYVHGAKDVGTRTVNLLMGEHAGEYVRGDIMDANAVVQAFDELKGNVDSEHDSLEEVVDELHNLRDATDQSFEIFQEKVEEETANRIQGDKTLDEKIDQKERESKERDNVLQQNINTEKQERINADTQLRNDLTAEVNRAKARENALASDIQAEATKRENDDNTIKDNLNAEVTRATAKENEIKAEVDVINGDSTTEGSFRKAIADVVGAAPEAYDTLKEIADKLNENDDLHAAINDAIATKATTVALNEEITRAKAAEAENKAEIAAEAARAKKVEGDNALAIQNEVSRATTVEGAINEAVNTEVERAKGQEAYLQNLINTKADTTALEGAKTELDKKISDETTRATGVEATKANADDLTAEVTRAKQAEAAITSDVAKKLAQKADNDTLTNYVLKTELPTIPTKTSQLTNDSNFITSADVDLTPYATTEALAAVDQRVTANTTAIANISKSNGIPYNPSVTNYYETNKPFYIKCDNDHTAYINPYSGIKVASSDTSYVDIIPSLLKLSNGDKTFEINQYIGGIQALDGTSDDSIGLKLNYSGLRIGKKSDINANNNELIFISRQTASGSSTFKVKGNSIENDVYLLDEEGLTNDKRYNVNTETLYLRHAALHGAILVDSNADLSIGYDTNIRTNPFWKFGFYGAEFNGSDSVKRIDIKTANFEYANIFGIKLKSYTNLATAYNDPCEIENNKDYVSFSKKIKVSDIITDTTTDSSLNTVLSKKQDKITPTAELDLTSIDTADIESLRSIVKSLAIELNTLGLIKLKGAEETA